MTLARPPSVHAASSTVATTPIHTSPNALSILYSSLYHTIVIEMRGSQVALLSGSSDVPLCCRVRPCEHDAYSACPQCLCAQCRQRGSCAPPRHASSSFARLQRPTPLQQLMSSGLAPLTSTPATYTHSSGCHLPLSNQVFHNFMPMLK